MLSLSDLCARGLTLQSAYASVINTESLLCLFVFFSSLNSLSHETYVCKLCWKGRCHSALGDPFLCSQLGLRNCTVVERSAPELQQQPAICISTLRLSFQCFKVFDVWCRLETRGLAFLLISCSEMWLQEELTASKTSAPNLRAEWWQPGTHQATPVHTALLLSVARLCLPHKETWDACVFAIQAATVVGRSPAIWLLGQETPVGSKKLQGTRLGWQSWAGCACSWWVGLKLTPDYKVNFTSITSCRRSNDSILDI